MDGPWWFILIGNFLLTENDTAGFCHHPRSFIEDLIYATRGLCCLFDLAPCNFVWVPFSLHDRCVASSHTSSQSNWLSVGQKTQCLHFSVKEVSSKVYQDICLIKFSLDTF